VRVREDLPKALGGDGAVSQVVAGGGCLAVAPVEGRDPLQTLGAVVPDALRELARKLGFDGRHLLSLRRVERVERGDILARQAELPAGLRAEIALRLLLGALSNVEAREAPFQVVHIDRPRGVAVLIRHDGLGVVKVRE